MNRVWQEIGRNVFGERRRDAVGIGPYGPKGLVARHGADQDAGVVNSYAEE